MIWFSALFSACSGPAPADCPETPFVPTGEPAATPADCDSERNYCAFECYDEFVCAGESGARSCEPCDALANFAEDCDGCNIEYAKGFMSFDCSSGT